MVLVWSLSLCDWLFSLLFPHEGWSIHGRLFLNWPQGLFLAWLNPVLFTYLKKENAFSYYTLVPTSHKMYPRTGTSASMGMYTSQFQHWASQFQHWASDYSGPNIYNFFFIRPVRHENRSIFYGHRSASSVCTKNLFMYVYEVCICTLYVRKMLFPLPKNPLTLCWIFVYMNYFYIHNHEREIINKNAYTWQSVSGWLIWREYEEVSCILLLYMHFLICITTNFYIHNNASVTVNMKVYRWQILLFLLLLSA